MLAGLRQLKYPKEFRIPPPAADEELADILQKVVDLLEHPPAQVAGAAGQEVAKFISDVATNLWRVRERLGSPDGGEASAGMRSLARAVTSTWDALVQGGVEIVNHTGEPYTGGEALNVLAFQPTAGLGRRQVIETIKPTVYYDGKLVQVGDVIVGTPE